MANANCFWNGTGSSFLEFTALQLWQVRLLMYSSGRANVDCRLLDGHALVDGGVGVHPDGK